MPVEKLKKFLDKNGVRYTTLTHSRAFTAQEIAASAHIRGKDMAKTVIVNIDGRLAMAVLPASYSIDFDQLKAVTGASNVQLASEDDFKELFPGCDLGAMPPFGSLYDLRTFMDTSLAEDEEIAFNAGSHTELIRLSFGDYVRLERPVELSFVLEPA